MTNDFTQITLGFSALTPRRGSVPACSGGGP
jgi:hypothetical protein